MSPTPVGHAAGHLAGALASRLAQMLLLLLAVLCFLPLPSQSFLALPRPQLVMACWLCCCCGRFGTTETAAGDGVMAVLLLWPIRQTIGV